MTETYIDEQGFVADLRERLEGIPEAEWPQHASEVELEILARHSAAQAR